MHEWKVLMDLKCLSMFCGWDLNYANCLRTCHVETVYVLWNYVLSLRTCHVLRRN